MAAESKLRILVIGAHPDDCEFKAGGVATLYQQAGHDVHFVSVTNGESGHHQLKGAELVAIRRKEAKAATDLIGITSEVLDFRDGYLEPTLEARMKIIGLIRSYQPDLILTHRLNDYHPDHRATSQLVCDAAYMVTVPPIVPEVPALRENPVIAYLSDDFQSPSPFKPSVVVDVGPVIETMIDMLDCHRSQFYEWIAYNMQYEDQLPQNESDRKAWFGEMFKSWIAPLADRYREMLVAKYGPEQGNAIQYIEAFEICEYGTQPDQKQLKVLFPF